MYRDPEYAATCRRTQGDEASPQLDRLIATRKGRYAAGIIGLLAFSGIILTVLALAFSGKPSYRWRSGIIATVLLWAWPAMGLAGLVAYGWLRTWPRRLAAATTPLTATLRHDSATQRRWQLDRAATLHRRSAAPLAAAIALLSPLTLHLAVYIVFSAPHTRLRDFDGYAAFALGAVWLAHIVVAVMSWRFFRRLRHTPLQNPHPVLAGLRDSAIAAATSLLTVAFVVIVGHVPYVFAACITAVIVLVTGFAYLPLTYWLGARWLSAEEQQIADLQLELGTDDLATS